MTKPDALLLTPEAPYPLVGGGPMRTASLAEYLSREYALDVIVFCEPGRPDPASAFPPGLARRAGVIELPYHSKRWPARVARNLIRFLRGRPPLNDRFSGFAKPIQDFLAGHRYKLAVVEHFWCAAYADEIAPHAETLVLDLHNVESVRYARSAPFHPWPMSVGLRRVAHACQRTERHWLPRFSLLLTASAEDARRVAQIAPGCRCAVYPNALPLVSRPQRAEEDVVVFSGNFDYPPNIAAVRFFRDRVWPRLSRRWPQLRWRLVGRNPGGVRRHVRSDPRIELTGPVEDALTELAAAKVVVVPLLSGSGTRVKIIEAWAAGRAVVSTSIGAEGLPAVNGQHLMLADTPEAFAQAVTALLESPDERRRLGQAGRLLYERELTWPAAWESLQRAGI